MKKSAVNTDWSALDAVKPAPPSKARPAAPRASLPADVPAAGLNPKDVFSAMLGGKRSAEFKNANKARPKNAADRAAESLAERERAADMISQLADELDRQAELARAAEERADAAETRAAEAEQRTNEAEERVADADKRARAEAERTAKESAALVTARAATADAKREIRSLGKKLAEAEKKQSDLESELEEARFAAENAKVREQDVLEFRAEYLRRELDDARRLPVATLLRGIPPGMVKEVFAGEIYDHVRDALENELKSAVAGGRDRHAEILEAVLAANPGTNHLADLRKRTALVVKRAGGFVDERDLRELEKIGFKVVSGSKHHKIRWGRGQVAVSKTGSDRAHGMENCARDLVNTAF